MDFQIKQDIKHVNFALPLRYTQPQKNSSDRICSKAETSEGKKNRRRKATVF